MQVMLSKWIKPKRLPVLREVSYTLFFVLMLAAKGIGLDSGDKLYFLLSAAALCCVMVKLVLTSYSRREGIVLLLVGALAIISYVNSGRLGIILTVCAVLGVKDIDINKLFRIGAVLFSVTFAGTVAAAAAGVIPNAMVVHEKGGIGEVIRWGMGYSTGNILHVSYFMLTVLLAFRLSRKKSFGFGAAAWLMAGNVIVFLFSLSYTGVIVTACYLVLNLYGVLRKKLGLVEKILCQLFLPICLAASFVVPFLLETPIGQKLNALLQARPAFSYYYLTEQAIKLFGGRMKDIPNFWVIMDNGYVYILMTFGIAVFCLVVLAYFILIARASGLTRNGSKEDLPMLAVIFSFVLYGVMEQFISNAFMNLSLFFAGTIIYAEPNERAEVSVLPQALQAKCSKWLCRIKEVIAKKSLVILMAGFLAGGAAAAVYFLAAAPPEYVAVPIDSLNYVDAQSTMIEIENEAGTKESLRQVMNEFQIIAENDDIVLQSIEEAGAGGMISSAELKHALEFALPQYIHNSGDYNAFRVRVLELYYDIPKETYAKIMQAVIAHSLEQADTLPIVSTKYYEEKIQKSAGKDRIEHMEVTEYTVEKSGTIARIEYVRKGLLAALAAVFTAVFTGSLLAALYVFGKNR